MEEWFDHGGRVDAAAAAFPHAPQPWLDLSTGINPIAWPLATASIDLTALPSRGALARLEAAAAEHVGADPERVVALPGSEIGLRLLATLSLPPPHRFVPGYGSYAYAFRDATPIDLDALDGGTDGTLLLGNPNNPDGRVLAPAAVLAMAGANGWVIVDEAFADAVPGSSVVPHLRPDTRAIVLRSFGKFFGLAGLRLGFAIAPPVIAARLRRQLGDWPVSTPAIVHATAAYRDTAWIAATRTALVERAAAVDALLARHGLRATGAVPLFRLIEDDRAAALFGRLATAGILTRPFAARPRWLRIGVPADAAARDRVDRALRRG